MWPGFAVTGGVDFRSHCATGREMVPSGGLATPTDYQGRLGTGDGPKPQGLLNT